MRDRVSTDIQFCWDVRLRGACGTDEVVPRRMSCETAAGGQRARADDGPMRPQHRGLECLAEDARDDALLAGKPSVADGPSAQSIDYLRSWAVQWEAQDVHKPGSLLLPGRMNGA